ncbi:MAG: RTA1 domain-containing protein [Candidatus Moranbacteria bacterium]|nr:RTA1 domain-containing protein [Candidatus Moranbacteria bacterium]
MEDQKQHSVTGKILGKIKEEGIHPEAPWKFTLRKGLLWTGIILAGLFAALSLSLVIFSLFSIDQGVFGFSARRLFSATVFRSLPFLWIASLLAFIAVAVVEFRETSHGYRHSPLFVALITVLVVIVTGSFLHLLRLGERSDDALRNALPPYEQAVESRENFWRHPEEGFVTGTVSETNGNEFTLESPDQEILDIRMDENTIVKPSVRIESGREVRVIGDREKDGTIDAEEILPALPPRLHDRGKQRQIQFEKSRQLQRSPETGRDNEGGTSIR